MVAGSCLRKIVRFILISLACSFVSLFFVYAFYTGQRHADYVRDPNVKCSHSELEMTQLLNLTYEVHTVLCKLEIDHWLMYGSVFGALRAHGPLPWDYDVDIGIRGEQFMKMKKSDFLGHFTARGIHCTDHIERNGLIALSRPGWSLSVDLFTFYDYDGIMKRPGWASWLLFVNYELHHTFPARLVKYPLPQMKFGFFNISVPHGGNEVTRYLYRFDWWKVVKPLRCRGT